MWKIARIGKEAGPAGAENGMGMVTLGKSGIRADKNAFGALPIQRISKEEAVKLLRKAYDNGFTFFDTARSYTDSEAKLGAAFAGMADRPVIATKTTARTVEVFWKDLHTSLEMLGVDCIDLYQLHNPPVMPKPGDDAGLYDALMEARAQGKIRHHGITNHRLPVAMEIAQSGLYETLQFPFSYLSGARDIELVTLCARENVGFIAMKALAGGLISNAAAAYAWLEQYPGVLPIWGIQRERELDEFIACRQSRPVLEGALQKVVEQDQAELQGNFCRGCGYCLPCPADIKINECARATLMMRRMPPQKFFAAEFQAEMAKIRSCTECGHCRGCCPYSLDVPVLLRRSLEEYEKVLSLN